MTINVSKEVESAIHAAVQSGRFPSVDEAVTAAWLAFNHQSAESLAASETPEAAVNESVRQSRPVWEEILELTADVPDEEWDRLPSDLAEQHDHYLYGAPKRPVS